MKLSEQYEEIIGWNEEDGTTHVRNKVVQLEEENEALRNTNHRRLGIIKSHGRQLADAAQWEWEQEQDEALLKESE